MNIQNLIEATQQPEIYTPGTAFMWEDEHISTQLLEVHLNQEVDLASRRESTINSTIEWIASKVPANNLNILDLGCGPGLYAEQLARRGHNVTGMDISAHSIRYARESASEKNLGISYIQQNYLALADENQYDLILLIFTDFGVLTPEERTTLLTRIHRALKPGGAFVFDVMNDRYRPRQEASRQWELSANGFWRKEPYLALSETFSYSQDKVILSQHLIVDLRDNVEIYRFWMHTFSHIELKKELVPHGFKAITCHDGIVPDSAFHRSDEVTFCIASK